MRARGATAAVLAAVLVVMGCGGGRTATTESTGTSTVTTPAPSEPGAGLSIGLTESNANLLRAAGDGPQPPPGLRPWRDRVSALAPQLYRLPIDWASLQPDAEHPARLNQPVDGCLRGAPPCGAYAGIKDILEAVGSQQAAGHGFQAMVVFYGVPDWAAQAPSGCERPGIQPRSRPINAAGLAAFRALVRDVASLARSEHADLRWWSAWNEPNGAFFISPQRERCSRESPPLSSEVYTRLFRAMRSELDEVPGDQRLVVGDLAGVAEPTPRGVGSGEFLRALPDDVVCSADVVAQHAYADLPGQKQLPGDPIAETERALDARPCARHLPIWITETGVGGPHAGDERQTGPEALRRQCVALQHQLRAWRGDPRIQAAFQYTFREDAVFPVGLADTGLTRTYPTYDLLRAWANRPRPDDPAPPLPSSCRS